MPEDEEPLDLDAHLEPPEIQSLELFRRSPHPYHRRQHELRPADAQAFSDASRHPLSHTTPGSEEHTISDQDGRKRRKISQSPSESGTEADDEGYGFVKALPAPPLRPRKGLRDLRGSGLDGTASPLLTPSQVDEEGRKFSAGYFKPRKDGARASEPSPTDEEARAARQKYLKRRRNELLRRTTETALLAFIGLLAVRGCWCWDRLLRQPRVELLTHVLVMAGVLGLYPLRLLYYSWHRRSPSNLRIRQRIRIPSAFDPAPILYPAILPILISISLYSCPGPLLLPNVVLGLAALPPQLIPCGTTGFGYSSTHWIISVLPLIASKDASFPSTLIQTIPYRPKHPPQEKGLQPEILASLFALHQALLPPLHYLTTTSLLPAELHLLSIGLINLLLFADTPQSQILKILLWLGGIDLFVLCGKILKWGVALARIPRWRFRRAGQVIKARQSFLQILNDSLSELPRSQSAGRARADSDADEDDPVIKSHLTKTKQLWLNMVNGSKDARIVNEGEPNSAVEMKTPSFSEHGDGSDGSMLPKRRNTLPSLPSHSQTTHRQADRSRSKSTAQSFLSLTPTQAALRKWIYAVYFYLVVIVTVLGPIRYLISKYALNDHEPFGWALGYLLGNIRAVRFQAFNWDLEWWIALPPILDLDDASSFPSSKLGRAEYLRRIVIGEANSRLLLCIYCATTIAVGLVSVFSLSSVVEVDTRRKVFHGTMVAMLLPTIYIDPCFVSLALALVLAVFLLLDLIRASQLPPLSRPIASFLTPYVDGRDLRGPVVVSHIFLLIGCAIPLWLSLASIDRRGLEPWQGWEVASRDVSMVTGVVCVGMGDAAASLIGRRYGRRKWPWAGGKSLEGSAAFAIAVTLGLMFGKVWLRVGQWDDVGNWGCVTEWIAVFIKASVCAAGASLNEAVLTGGNDNVIVPVVLWVLARGVRL